MADLSQTPANVRAGTGAVTELATAGEAFDAGTPVYFKSTDGKYYKADANDANAYNVAGIALTGSSAANGLFVLQTAGVCCLGATISLGLIYVVSATVGKIAPSGDLTSGWYPAIIGVGLTTGGNVQLICKSGTVAVA